MILYTIWIKWSKWFASYSTILQLACWNISYQNNGTTLGQWFSPLHHRVHVQLFGLKRTNMNEKDTSKPWFSPNFSILSQTYCIMLPNLQIAIEQTTTFDFLWNILISHQNFCFALVVLITCFLQSWPQGSTFAWQKMAGLLQACKVSTPTSSSRRGWIVLSQEILKNTGQGRKYLNLNKGWQILLAHMMSKYTMYHFFPIFWHLHASVFLIPSTIMHEWKGAVNC